MDKKRVERLGHKITFNPPESENASRKMQVAPQKIEDRSLCRRGLKVITIPRRIEGNFAP